MKKHIPLQQVPQKRTVINNTNPNIENKYCSFNFRYLKTTCININEFNNFFKDSDHFLCVISSFIGTILPKISDMTPSQLASDGRLNQQFHFHKVHYDKYSKIRSIMEAYAYNKTQIDQFLDGENIYQFTGNLEGGDTESRIICDYNQGVLYILFFDTNHHLYFNKSLAGESVRFSFCPFETNNTCHNAFNCFAKAYLDYKKIEETFGYTYQNI